MTIDEIRRLWNPSTIEDEGYPDRWTGYQAVNHLLSVIEEVGNLTPINSSTGIYPPVVCVSDLNRILER